MDRYHAAKYWVYDDVDSPGNHFLVWPSFTNPGSETHCPVVMHGDTRGAPPAEPISCDGTEPLDSAHVEWRRYEPPETGEATFSLCESSFDTVLSIHDGCPGPDQIQLECDDDACGQQSELTFEVSQGQSYLIRIAGKGEAAGPYTLTIDGPTPPDPLPILNCGVSVEFDAFTTEIYEDGGISPIHSGATAIQFRFNYAEELDYGGLIMNNGVFPEGGPLGPNWGTVPGAGVEDLAGARALKFHARGEKGGETVTFFVGGVGWDGDTPVEPYRGSTPAIEIEVELETDWTEYTIDLEGVDLSYVIGGFGWAANAMGDPDLNQPGSDNALIFYVDEIYFELDEAAATERLWNSPRFLQSFTTRPVQGSADPVVGDFDHRFRGVAFVYDNALALLAFLAEGTEEGLDRARLVGDAFLYAATHDRSLPDGRLRSAYSAGDLTLPPGWIPNGIEGEVRLAGFYNPQCQEFQQLFADNISVGNTAWAMIALLALYQESGESSYLDGAQALGEFIRGFRDDTCVDENGLKIGGFAGGLDHIEAPDPVPVTFSSAEHNIDVHAAFTVMHEITGEESWLDDAEHARRFLWWLWGGDQLECFYTGMDLESCEINTAPGQLPLDVQAWVVLGIPEACQEFRDALQCATDHHLTQCHGFEGFDFNDDRDGIWFEGTGHMATAYAFLIQMDQADAFRSELCRAQAELPEPPLRQEVPPPFNNPIGLVAGCHDGISTGFGFQVYKRLHVAATAWHVFAETGVNPFFLGTPTFADCDDDGVPDYMDDCLDSDTSPTIVIDGCQTDVVNQLLGDGCSMSDLIARCADGAPNHGSFVSRVARLTASWKRDGLISGKEKGRIQRCAGQAGLP